MTKLDQVYSFIREYIDKNDIPPTIREIANAVGVKSTSTVSYYLKRLSEDGRIIKGAFRNRAVQIVDDSNKVDPVQSISMPLVDKITIGLPLLTPQNILDKILVSAELFKGYEMFMMPVKDESMVKMGILKDDYIVISRQNVARNGEPVVAIVKEQLVLGRLYKEFEFFRLQPQNPSYEPIYASRIVILGKIVGVIRRNVM